MKIFKEKIYTNWKNLLILISLSLITLLLTFEVYSYFEKPLKIVISTIFPFILSFVTVYTLMPFIDILNEKYKLNRKLSITVVLLIFFALLLYVILGVIPLIVEQISGLTLFFVENQNLFQNKIINFLEVNNVNIKDHIINSKDMILNNGLKAVTSSFSFLTGAFTLIFMTPIFTIMLIYSYDSMGEGTKKLLKKINQEKWIPLISQIDDAIGRYIKVTVLDSVIVGICSYIVFFSLKMEYSSLFAILIAVWNGIPFIGPFLGLIPAILYALTKSFRLAVLIIVLITIVQSIEANIIKPYITSKSVDIHPITTILVVLVGGALYGMGGAFVAIPVYIAIKLSVIFYYNNILENNKDNSDEENVK